MAHEAKRSGDWGEVGMSQRAPGAQPPVHKDATLAEFVKIAEEFQVIRVTSIQMR